MIDSLQNEHRRLQQEVGEATPINEALIVKIKGFIVDCIKAGMHISNIDDRSELRSILRYWGNFVFRATLDPSYLTVQIEEPILGLTRLRLTFEDLIANRQQRANQFVAERVREGVFDPTRAIRREQVESRVWDFLHSDRTGLVITGATGVGKTFLLCQLAEKPWRTDKETTLILPYDCQELGVAISPLDRELGEAVEYQIARSLGVNGPTSLLEMELNYIDELLKQYDSYLLVCLDAIERFKVNRIEKPDRALREIPMVRELLLSLNNIVKTFAMRGATRIKFLLTSVNSTWASLGPERLMAWNLYFASSEETRSLIIERFKDDELEDAYEAYAVSVEAREKIQWISEGNPYILRLASDLMSRSGKAKIVTKDLVFRELYNKRVLRGTHQEQIQKQRFLLEFAKKAKELPKDGQKLAWGVPSEDIDFSDPAYELLELDGIISQEKIREPFPQIVITLNPPELAEFILKWYGAG